MASSRLKRIGNIGSNGAGFAVYRVAATPWEGSHIGNRKRRPQAHMLLIFTLLPMRKITAHVLRNIWQRPGGVGYRHRAWYPRKNWRVPDVHG